MYTPKNIAQIDKLRIKSLEQENEELKQNYYKLEMKHKDKKTRHHFKIGNCFYIVRDVDCKYVVYKFGQTSNFTNRLSTLRTSSPRMIVERLVYIEKHKDFENCLKQHFRENGHLRFSNHEYVEIPLDYVNKIVDSFLVKFNCDIYDTPIEMLQHINKRYLDCMTVDEKMCDNDAIFQYIQQQNNIQNEKIEKIQYQTNIHTENIEKIHIKLEKLEEYIKFLINKYNIR